MPINTVAAPGLLRWIENTVMSTTGVQADGGLVLIGAAFAAIITMIFRCSLFNGGVTRR